MIMVEMYVYVFHENAIVQIFRHSPPAAAAQAVKIAMSDQNSSYETLFMLPANCKFWEIFFTLDLCQ